MKILFSVWLFFVLPVSVGLSTREVSTLWINSRIVKASNPFFTNGITITVDGQKYELGLREDGIVVWKKSK